ncbi:MAG: alanine--tRNA ligase-related protein [Candidatus Moranbacteria bacterium]|nr:alanine--tRNA ligase-related protein [Candidatus Moranbacteria bacterium]
MKLSVKEIKRLLLDFHARRGYQIFESFPLITDDPTVMFTNATITPFKSWFTDPGAAPCNFALVQRCFRAGGSGNMDEIGHNPNAHAFFEMFGTGTFGIDHVAATEHLFEMLGSIGIDKKNFFFTVPPGGEFQVGLEANGIPSSRIFTIEENGAFWCKWQFGKNGLTGRGLTAIYASGDESANVVDCLAEENRGFVELLNLIHIYGQQNQDGTIGSIANPGFEIGMGVERVATILQDCDGFQIDNMKPLVEIVGVYLSTSTSDFAARACTEYLRSICILLEEGLFPSNKKAGYVLRKIIRRFMEHTWLIVGKAVFVEDLIKEFICMMNSRDPSMHISEFSVIDSLRKEHALLEQTLERGIKIIQKDPDISQEILLDTYGLSPSLVQLIKRGEAS